MHIEFVDRRRLSGLRGPAAALALATVLLGGCSLLPDAGPELSGEVQSGALAFAPVDRIQLAANTSEVTSDVADVAITESDLVESEIDESEVAGSETAESDVAESDVAESDVAESDVAASDVSDISDMADIVDIAQSSDIADEGEMDDGDPIETVNRFVFAFNDALDTAVIRPVAVTYRDWVPMGVRDSVRNFLRNLRTPVILMNDLLQGETERAGTTFWRFFINTGLGAGFFDHADGLGLKFHNEDFGQTLAVWGLGEGFYLVLPVLGPSSARDAVGKVVDYFADPLVYWADDVGREEWMVYRAVIDGVDYRSRLIEPLDEARRDSLDYYARIRSLWRQVREREINNEEADNDLPAFSLLDDRQEAAVPTQQQDVPRI